MTKKGKKSIEDIIKRELKDAPEINGMTLEEISKLPTSPVCPTCGHPYGTSPIIGRAKVYRLRQKKKGSAKK